MAGQSGVFLLGLFCGATALIALFSLFIGRAYREQPMWWLCGTLVTGMLPVLASLSERQVPVDVLTTLWRSSGWATLALSTWTLRLVLPQTEPLRLPRRALAGLVLLAMCVAATTMFMPLPGLSMLLVPVWLLVMVPTFMRAWVRCSPWIYWMAAGEVAAAVAWVGLAWNTWHGIPPSGTESIIWRAMQTALYGGSVYLGLVWRSRLRSEVNLRVMAIERTDPLTGLARPRVLAERLEAASARSRTFGYRTALLGLRVTNLYQLAKDNGLDNDELALVAASRAISAVLRDVDLASRTANNCFVVLVEGVASHEALNDLATRIIANGLRAEPVRGLSLVVKFQCVILELGHVQEPPRGLLEHVAAEVTQWPEADRGKTIRFLEPFSKPSALQ